MRNLYLSILLFLCAGTVQASNSISEVPFSIERGHVIVQLKIRKDLPVEVVIATGARRSLVETSLLEKYKLRALYSNVYPVTGSNDPTHSFTVVTDLRLGDVSVSTLTMHLESLSTIRADVGREIFGVLGSDFLEGLIVQFDFSKKVVRFLEKVDAPIPDKDTVPCSKDVGILEMVEDKDELGDFIQPIANEAVFDGQKIKTLFDTGAAVVLAGSASSAKKFGHATPAEKGPALRSKLRTISLGGCQLNDVPVVFAAKDSAFDRSFRGHGMIVGIGVLQNFLVTFDYSKKIIVLDRR